MNPLLSVIPLLIILTIVPAIYGGFIRLSAKFLSYEKITWKLGFIFGLIMSILSIIWRVIFQFIGHPIPLLLSLALGLVLNLLIGGWFFANRGITVNGETIKWSGAVKLTGIAFIMIVSIGLALTHLPKMILTT